MYSFIDNHRGRYPVELMARVLRISPRSYYNYTRGIVGFRERRREELEHRIGQVYSAAKGRYGSPRIACEITASGHKVSAQTVAVSI